MTSEHSIPIAIVGIAAELPSGQHSSANLDYDAFFEFLMSGGESYEKIPFDRFNIDEWKGRQPGKIIAERGSFLKNLASFDHLEFGITSKDARAMAVSTRKLIELSFLALLDSGIDYRGRNVGCFTSGIAFDILTLGAPDEFEARGSFGGLPAQIANRISYHLDLLGPSVPTDTACSSSLTAMHLAVQAVRSGDCEAAVVGGCQLNQRLLDFIQYTQGSVLSPDGKCKPFDASADGFSRAEAAVVVVVKPLESALHDGDKIYGTILGTGINSTGSAAPVYAPVGPAQEDAMRRAFKQAGRNPQDVDFLELHATGTAQGDPTEANWVGRAFKRAISEEDLLIGSVKGNIGHTEIAAFLVSLCKVTSIFTHGVIPPNVNFKHPNPSIKWNEYHLKVPLEPTPVSCRSESGRSLVAILSSGIGGANGHCVVEAPPRREQVKIDQDPNTPALLVVGALSPRTTALLADSVAQLARDHLENLPSISTLYGRRSRQMTWRSFAVVNPEDTTKIRFSQPVLTTRVKPAVGFVFSGQGPQHMNMGRQLYQSFPVFRESVAEMDAVYTKFVGHSLLRTTGLFDTFVPIQPLPEVWPIDIILPSITIVQIAIFDLLASLGVKPDFVLGHSAGETTVLYASGAASKAMAVELAIARGKALALTEPAGGTMAAVSCGPAAIAELLEKARSIDPDAILEVACHNSEEAITVAGHNSAIDVLVELCTSRGIAAQKLRTNVAVHSSMMERCKEQYFTLVEDVFARYPGPHRPAVDVYSAVSGRLFDEDFDMDYFWKNTRHPVLFTETLQCIRRTFSAKPYTIVEISAHPVLSAYLSSLCPESTTIVCPMRRTKQMSTHHERTVLLQALGNFVTAGHNNVNFSALNGGTDHHVSFPLPAYPFAPKEVPYMSRWVGQDKIFVNYNGPLNHPRLRVNANTHPDMAQHVMKGEPILPATGFVEMVLEFGAQAIWDAQFHSFLSLSSEEPVPVTVELNGTRWKVSSRTSVSQNARLHAEGHLSLDQNTRKPKPTVISHIRERCQAFSVHGFYEDLRYFAEYGPLFRLVQSCHIGESEFLVEVDTKQNRNVVQPYRFDPAILDACIHVMVHPVITGNMDQKFYYLPSRFRRFFVHNLSEENVTGLVYAHGSNARWTPTTITYDVLVVNAHGDPICEFRGFEVALHGAPLDISLRYDLNLEPTAKVEIAIQGSAAKIADNTLTDKGVGDEQIFLAYRQGEEALLQQELAGINSKTRVLWLLSSSNHAGAASGFSRALRRELSCAVRLIIFESDLSLSQQLAVVASLQKQAIYGNEIIIDPLGQVLVPRLHPSKPPSVNVLFELEKPWQIIGQLHAPFRNVVQTSMPSATPGRAIVRVRSIALDVPSCGIWSFVGDTMSGDPVIAVTSHPIGNYVSTACELVVRSPEISMSELKQAASYSIPAIIGYMALGSPHCSSKAKFQKTALVTHANTDVGIGLVQLFQFRGITVSSLDGEDDLTGLLSIDKEEFDYVLSGTTDVRLVTVLRSLCSPTGASVFWNDPDHGIRDFISKNATQAGLALRQIIPTLKDIISDPIPSTPVEHLLSGDYPSTVPDQRALFHGDKVYLLLGGIGSLGLRVATWMYENGARHIVLTSRSGRKTLTRTQNFSALRILKYLEGLEDLNLRVEACDASDELSMRALVDSLSGPIAGCMLLTAILEDKMFASLTQDSFSRVFAAKVGVFNAVREVLEISGLDFCATFSSVSGLFGSAGQTNYASANTALEAMTREYSNAFSIVAPAVLDTSIAFGSGESRTTRNSKVKHLTEWGMSSMDICRCLEDGIRKLKDGPFWLYVPDFNWASVREHMGESDLFSHLLDRSTSPTAVESEGSSKDTTILEKILKILDLDEQDFSPEVPLTSYGLDSLLASKLSVTLRPWVSITQLQLLADITFNNIIERIESDSSSTELDSVSNKNFFDWEEVLNCGNNVVKLSDGEGTPLYLLHGPAGSIEAFEEIRKQFTTPLYGVQATADTPYHSLPDLAQHYFQKIKVVQPTGPYRLGGFCGSSLLVFLLAEVFQKNGDEVIQVSVIDHYPMLYASPVWEIDALTAQSDQISEPLRQRGFAWIMNLYRNEPSPLERRAGEELQRAGMRENVRPHIKQQYDNTMTFIQAHAKFMTRFVDSLPQSPSESFDPSKLRARFIEWLSHFKLPPVTLYLASQGMKNLFTHEQKEWDTLGSKLCSVPTDVNVVEAGHFDILSNRQFISSLERDWETAYRSAKQP